jgi:hypothetical protein
MVFSGSFILFFGLNSGSWSEKVKKTGRHSATEFQFDSSEITFRGDGRKTALKIADDEEFFLGGSTTVYKFLLVNCLRANRLAARNKYQEGEF